MRLLATLLTFCGVLPPAGCDGDADSQSRSGATTAATSAAAPFRGTEADAYHAKLAALRHLVEDQSLEADRRAFVAYVVKDADESAAPLAEALAAAFAGRAPPVLAADKIEIYTRKGRTMDRSTGRPVKVFQARVADLHRAADAAGAAGAGTRADVRATWQAGRLAGAAWHYRLRRDRDGWAVEGRAAERP